MSAVIREMGNNLLLVLSVGDTSQSTIFYPTTGGLWVAKGDGSVTDPEPPVGGGGAWTLPVDSRFKVTRPNGDFGPRNVSGGSSYHEGVDFNGDSGGGAVNNTPIYAVSSGTVVTAGSFGAFGNAVRIDHPDGSRTLYGHMIKAPDVNVGDTVSTGQKIGNVGSTGQSTGPHLHFETRVTPGDDPSDPEPFMQARGVTIPTAG